MLVYDITLAYLTILYGLMSIITVDINVMVKSHFNREKLIKLSRPSCALPP